MTFSDRKISFMSPQTISTTEGWQITLSITNNSSCSDNYLCHWNALLQEQIVQATFETFIHALLWLLFSTLGEPLCFVGLWFCWLTKTIRSNVCVLAALLNAKTVKCSLLILKPSVFSSFLEAKIFFESALKFTLVSLVLYTSWGE